MDTPGKDLQLGDVVELFESEPYAHATVKKLSSNTATFFRPYVHTADFSYTGGVICYIGIEELTCPLTQSFRVIRRGGTPPLAEDSPQPPSWGESPANRAQEGETR